MIHQNILQQFINQLMEDNGIERSFNLLLSVLKQNIPLSYFACLALEKQKNRVTPLFYISEDGINVSSPDNYFEWEKAVSTYRVTEIPDVEITLINDLQAEVSLNKLIVDAHDTKSKALLIMVLYSTDEFIYSFGLRANKANVFTLEHAKALALLHPVIVNLIQLLFEPNKKTLPLISQTIHKKSSIEMIEQCRGLKDVLQHIYEVAPTNANVLIHGETGVGKEIVAEAIHNSSKRLGRPMVKINCGAIPESLLEAELFGYEKGSFTGALGSHQGFFEQAHNGTLYLDEIAELSPMAQAKLLRVLESHEIQRIGSTKRILLDFRLIVGTNKNLKQMVKNGEFREDLWYRINAYTIFISPLRERKEDIPVLAKYFAVQSALELGLEYQPIIKNEIFHTLMLCNWHGNIRELRHWIERALIYTNAQKSPVLIPPRDTSNSLSEYNVQKLAVIREFNSEQKLTLDELNCLYIEWALSRCNGRIQGKGSVSELLGIKGSTLRSRMKKFGIKFPQS